MSVEVIQAARVIGKRVARKEDGRLLTPAKILDVIEGRDISGSGAAHG